MSVPKELWKMDIGALHGGISSRTADERAKLIRYRDPETLLGLMHPINERLYGKVVLDEAFLKSIREDGVIEPIVLCLAAVPHYAKSGGGHRAELEYVISGHRRIAAAIKVGLKKVPVRVMSEQETSEAQVEKYLILYNQQRVKSVVTKAREFKELKRIEVALAKEREHERKIQTKSTLANLPKSLKPPKSPAPKDVCPLPYTGGDSATASMPDEDEIDENENNQQQKYNSRATAAAAVGLSPRTADKLEKLVDAADAGNPNAVAALDEIDRKKGRGVDTAYKAIVTPKPPSVAAPARAPQPTSAKFADKQEKQTVADLENKVTALTNNLQRAFDKNRQKLHANEEITQRDTEIAKLKGSLQKITVAYDKLHSDAVLLATAVARVDPSNQLAEKFLKKYGGAA